jgi:hypothetical protein
MNASRVQLPDKVCRRGTELFSTGNYISLTIVQLPSRSYWFRVDTGKGKVDYIAQADQVNCSIIGATLISARAQESEKISSSTAAVNGVARHRLMANRQL